MPADYIDNYSEHENVWTTSRDPRALSPHDTNKLSQVPKALYVGVGGSIILRGVASTSDVAFLNIPSGSTLLVQPLYIRSTGTTATGLIGLY